MEITALKTKKGSNLKMTDTIKTTKHFDELLLFFHVWIPILP